METAKIIYNKSEPINDSIVLVGFPSVGYASVIAANYLVSELDMEYVGTIESDGFPTVATIHNYIPTYPSRIYQKDKLIIVLADISPSKDSFSLIGKALIDWIEQNNCRILVSFDGLMPHNLEDFENMETYGVASLEEMRKTLKEKKIEQIQEGFIAGISGIMLVEGAQRNINVLALLTEAQPMYPDAKAGARLIETLSKILPEVKVDMKKLYENAEEIEKSVRAPLEQVKQLMEAKKVPSAPFMYG